MEIATTMGRRESFEELYAQHGPAALHLAYLLTGDRNRAEDVAQEAFLKLLSRFGELRKPESARSYLLRSVSNLAKNEFRRDTIQKKHAAPQREEVVAPRSLDESDALVRRLRQLPHRQQVAVVLRYCVDLSEQETAEAMGTSAKAVKSLVTRGLAALRAQEEDVV